jgi:polar amino acid transport system permease protein
VDQACAIGLTTRARYSSRPRLLAIVGLVGLSLSLSGCGTGYSWNWKVVASYSGVLLEGLRYTLIVSTGGIVIGLAWGLVVAVARLSRFRVIRVSAITYIEVMRCTPLLVQLVWIYYALPTLTGIQLSAVVSATLALVLDYGAFYGESFRSGIQAVPKDEIDSARVLGLNYVDRLRYVIVPRAFRTVLPVLISLSVGLFKDSSLISFLGVADLLYQANLVSSETFRPLETLSTAAAIYFAIAFPATLASAHMEKRLNRYRAAN